MVGVRRHEAASGAAAARNLHARLDAEPVLRASLPRALPRPRAHRARRGRDARLRRHARAGAREARRWSRRLAPATLVEREPARHGLSVGDDPHTDAGGEPGRGRTALARRARGYPSPYLAVSRDVRLRGLPRPEVNVRRRVLLTGGTGFVGANLVRRLLADGHAVHLVVRPERSLWRLAGIRDDVKLHQASLEDRAAVERVVRRARPEWVFHLAAHGAYSWETDPDRILAVNLLGTVNPLRGGSRATTSPSPRVVPRSCERPPRRSGAPGPSSTSAGARRPACARSSRSHGACSASRSGRGGAPCRTDNGTRQCGDPTVVRSG